MNGKRFRHTRKKRQNLTGGQVDEEEVHRKFGGCLSVCHHRQKA